MAGADKYAPSTEAIKYLFDELELLDKFYKILEEEPENAHSEALLLMKKWKSLSEFKNGLFEEISGFSIGQLGIESKLRNCNIEAVRHFDDYRIIEEEIILNISQKVESEAISSREISQMVADRKDLFWFLIQFSDSVLKVQIHTLFMEA